MESLRHVRKVSMMAEMYGFVNNPGLRVLSHSNLVIRKISVQTEILYSVFRVENSAQNLNSDLLLWPFKLFFRLSVYQCDVVRISCETGIAA